MAYLKMVEARCNYKQDNYGFTPVTDFAEEVYVCSVPRCDKRLGDRRTLVVIGKSLGEFPITEVSMCGMPECRFTLKQG